MILPSDFPYRFFNPLTSKHREDYVHVLLSLEFVLEQAKRIAMPRNALMSEVRRTFRRENYALDVSDEEDYDEEVTDDPEQDNLAFTIRLFLRSGWIDTDESGDHLTESVFLTQYGKKLTGFFKGSCKNGRPIRTCGKHILQSSTGADHAAEWANLYTERL